MYYSKFFCDKGGLILNSLGQCEVLGYKCKFQYENFRLAIIPDDNDIVGSLYRSIRDDIQSKNFIVRTDSLTTKGAYCLYICSKVDLSIGGGGIYLDVIYHFEFYATADIDSIAIYSDTLTKYVEIPSYYFKRKENGEKLLSTTDDLLYHFDEINSFSFNYQVQTVKAHIDIGNILMRGIASDLKLKSRLVLSFTPSNNNDFIIDLCEGVTKVLQFLCYEKEIVFNRIELVGSHNNKRSILGELYTPNNKADVKYRIEHSPYPLMENQLGLFFEKVLSDKKLYTRHLPKNSELFSSDVIRFLNIFSAFENEYNKLPKETKKKDASKYDLIRSEIINKLNDMNTEDTSEVDKEFINMTTKRVSELGKSYGERQKLSMSFNLYYDYLKSSFKRWGVKQSQIDGMSENLCTLRDKVVHNNFDGEIDDHITKIQISMLERLTYAMMLKRYKIANIENIISATFF